MTILTDIPDEKIYDIWQWCHDAYIQYGVKINFPKNTDPKKTYQWRFTKAIAKKFDEWNFDEQTSKKFINIAIKQAKQAGVLKKGLAALHQSNLLTLCYKILTSEKHNNKLILQELYNTMKWFKGQISDKNLVHTLLQKEHSRALPNIVIWYKANKVSDLFMAISKACNQAICKLPVDSIERKMLPSTTTLYLLRSEFLSEAQNIKVTKSLFGSDWRQP